MFCCIVSGVNIMRRVRYFIMKYWQLGYFSIGYQDTHILDGNKVLLSLRWIIDDLQINDNNGLCQANVQQ